MVVDEEYDKDDEAFDLDGVRLGGVKDYKKDKNNGGCSCYYS
jgi:hypothetical protein